MKKKKKKKKKKKNKKKNEGPIFDSLILIFNILHKKINTVIFKMDKRD